MLSYHYIDRGDSTEIISKIKPEQTDLFLASGWVGWLVLLAVKVAGKQWLVALLGCCIVGEGGGSQGS